MSKNSICFILKWSPSRTSFLKFKLLKDMFFQDETARKRNYIIDSRNARLHKITSWPRSLEDQGSKSLYNLKISPKFNHLVLGL